MKKFFSKILIAIFMLGIFLAPFTPRYSEKEGVILEINKKNVLAQCGPGTTGTPPNCVPIIDAGPSLINNTFTVTDSQGNAGTINNTASNNLNTNGKTCSFGSISTWHVCIIGWLYWLIFVPVAFFTRLAAYILDFFLFYSIQSGSYTGEFIENGWRVVRDIANIFFIIALLYVAIKTALALNASDNKRMIGMIVIIALIINFSLFATQIVIDASNILAKIFYSNIESVNANGELIPTGEDGAKSITIGLVRTFDPQTIFKLESVTDDLTVDNAGTFFATLVMSVILMIYMIFMFITVALVFIGRVVMLWLLMIFSPIAFVSLTMPGVRIPGFGWGEWTKQLFDNAFVAPIFVFLLYIIILFGDVVKIVTGGLIDTNASQVAGTNIDQASGSTFDTYVKVLIPFILILILLMKTKEVALKMSGDLGEKLSKVGSMAGGLAFGAMLGGAAALGTQGIGRLANKLGDGNYAEKLRDRGVIRDKNGNVIGAKKGLGAWAARQQLKTIDYGKKASFDLRQTKLGETLGKQSGWNFQSASAIGLGSQKGGYLGYQDRVDEQAKKDAELYKTSMSDPQVKAFTVKRNQEYLKNTDSVVSKQLEKERQARLEKGLTMTAKEEKDFQDNEKRAYEASAPKIYEKAEQLNQERMVMFKDRFGQTGLLSSLSHSLVEGAQMQVNQNNFQTGDMRTAYLKIFKEKKKKQAEEEAAKNNQVFDENLFNDKHDLDLLDKTSDTYKESNQFDVAIAKTINDNRAMKVKAGIGIAAGAITGVGIGAMTGSVLMGTATGVGSGVSMASREVDKSTTDKVIDRMDKEAKNTQNLANRIKDLKDILEEGKRLTRTPAGGLPGLPVQPIPLNLFNGEQLDKNKLRDEIAQNQVLTEAARTNLRNNPNDVTIQKELAELIKESELLKQLQRAETDLFNLTGKKPNSGGGTPPPATP